MKGPEWMPLNIADYFRDTAHLSATEHGAYLLLIMRYWSDGGLPNDEDRVRALAHLTKDQWIESQGNIAAFFTSEWRHKRIDAELAKAAELMGKRRAAASARHVGSKSSAHAEHVQSFCSAHAEHVQNNSSYTRVPPKQQQPSSPFHSEEGTRERGVPAPEFDEFWTQYPHKVGKADAAKSFAKARDRADLEAIMAGLARYVAKTDDRPWCNPATWLNQDRWMDEPAVTPLARGSPPKPSLAAAFGQLSAEMRRQHEVQSGTGDGGVQPALLDLSAVRR